MRATSAGISAAMPSAAAAMPAMDARSSVPERRPRSWPPPSSTGATEATNLAIIGYAMRNRRKGDHVVITEAEHISVLNIAKYLEKNGFKVTHAPIDLYGPRGLGALYVRKGVQVAPVLLGGGQERGLRSGTEDLASIAGMAAAEQHGRHLH